MAGICPYYDKCGEEGGCKIFYYPAIIGLPLSDKVFKACKIFKEYELDKNLLKI